MSINVRTTFEIVVETIVFVFPLQGHVGNLKVHFVMIIDFVHSNRQNQQNEGMLSQTKNNLSSPVALK